jgi:hypothetical protein
MKFSAIFSFSTFVSIIEIVTIRYLSVRKTPIQSPSIRVNAFDYCYIASIQIRR